MSLGLYICYLPKSYLYLPLHTILFICSLYLSSLLCKSRGLFGLSF